MSVPHLDLAPKLKRPLQLWNPLDYVRLFYWIFFFPQALHWYIEGLCNIEHREATGRDLLSALREDRTQRDLVVQAMLLDVLILVILSTSIQWCDLPFSWLGVVIGATFSLILFGVAGSLTLGIGSGIALGVSTSSMAGITLALAWNSEIISRLGVMGSSMSSLSSAVGSGALVGVAAGVMIGLMYNEFTTMIGPSGRVFKEVDIDVGIAYGIKIFGTAISSWLYSALSSSPIILLIALDVTGVGSSHLTKVLVRLVFYITGFFISANLITGVTILRMLNYLLATPIAWKYSQEQIGVHRISHVTPIPLPGVQRRLDGWLIRDWDSGLHNANQLLTYTLQFIPVVNAVNSALAKLPHKRLLMAVSEISRFVDWELVYFGSAQLRNAVWHYIIQRVFIVPNRFRQRWQTHFPVEPRLDTLARAACAGFLYLHEQAPEKAAEAFAVVSGLPHGEEMARLAQALERAQEAGDLSAIAALTEQEKFTIRLQEYTPVLHPPAWQSLEHLQRTALEVRTVRQSISRAVRSQALNRALGGLTTVLNEIDRVPETERELIRKIASRWREVLLNVVGEVGEAAITEPVVNPYVVGDPVIGDKFVGRAMIVRRLEELWAGSQIPPSVVLFGHRRMGKSSILRNLSGHLGSDVYLAYVTLLLLGDAPGGAGDVLLAIADQVAQTLRRAGYTTPTVDPDAINARPYRGFEHFLQATRELLGDARLVIALDEFEQLETWIEMGKLPRDFLKVLRGYIQLDPQIAFAFAGLHTLEEMTADYFEPFFASVIAQKVGFMSRRAVSQLLVNPATEDFPLDYTPGALEQIWQLTAGQPYLVQLIGHRLVSRFNDLTFEQGQQPAPRFDVDDVEAVVEDKLFYQMGRYYFTGVWGQAAQGVPGQQAVLTALAPSEEGLGVEELLHPTDLKTEKALDALKTLARHDVLKEEAGRWRFTVELMRRWVLKEDSS